MPLHVHCHKYTLFRSKLRKNKNMKLNNREKEMIANSINSHITKLDKIINENSDGYKHQNEYLKSTRILRSEYKDLFDRFCNSLSKDI